MQKYNDGQENPDDRITLEQIDFDFMVRNENSTDDEDEAILRHKALARVSMSYFEARTLPFFKSAEVVRQIVELADESFVWPRLLLFLTCYVLVYQCLISYDYYYGKNDISYSNAFYYFAQFRPSISEYFYNMYLSPMDKFYQAAILT